MFTRFTINNLGSYSLILNNPSYLALMDYTPLWVSVPSVSSSGSSLSPSLLLPSPPAFLPRAFEGPVLSHRPRPPLLESSVLFQNLLIVHLSQLAPRLLKLLFNKDLNLFHLYIRSWATCSIHTTGSPLKNMHSTFTFKLLGMERTL